MTSPLLPSLRGLARFEHAQTGALGRYRLDDATLEHVLSQVHQHRADSVWRHMLAWIIDHLGGNVDISRLASLLGHLIAAGLVVVAIVGAGLIVYLLVRGVSVLPARRGSVQAVAQGFAIDAEEAVPATRSGLRAAFEQWADHLQRLQIIRRAAGVTNGEIQAALTSQRPPLADRFRDIRPALDLCFYAPARSRLDDAISLEAAIRKLDAET